MPNSGKPEFGCRINRLGAAKVPFRWVLIARDFYPDNIDRPILPG